MYVDMEHYISELFLFLELRAEPVLKVVERCFDLFL